MRFSARLGSGTIAQATTVNWNATAEASLDSNDGAATRPDNSSPTLHPLPFTTSPRW